MVKERDEFKVSIEVDSDTSESAFAGKMLAFANSLAVGLDDVDVGVVNLEIAKAALEHIVVRSPESYEPELLGEVARAWVHVNSLKLKP